MDGIRDIRLTIGIGSTFGMGSICKFTRYVRIAHLDLKASEDEKEKTIHSQTGVFDAGVGVIHIAFLIPASLHLTDLDGQFVMRPLRHIGKFVSSESRFEAAPIPIVRYRPSRPGPTQYLRPSTFLTSAFFGILLPL